MEENTGHAPENGEQNQAPGTPENQNSENKGSHMVPKSRLDQEIAKRREMESTMAAVIEEMKNEIPEQFRGIIPEGLSPTQLIDWMRKATKAGLFSGPQANNGPDTRRPGGKPPTDYEGMSPQAIMARGYKTA